MIRKIWRLAVDSIHEAPRDFDYTDRSLKRAVILLGVPMVLEMLMESVFAVTDIFFVGHLGPQAVATMVGQSIHGAGA